MTSDLLGLIELLIVLGIVLGFAVFEVVSLKRAKRRETAVKPLEPPADPSEGP